MASVTDMAYMSKGAYNPASMQGNLPDYYIDNSLSTVDRTVYVNKSTGKATIAFRGTDTEHKDNTWRDIGADISIVLGLEKYNHRFKNSLNATKAAVAKYGADNVTVTGHSLGGSQAMYVSQKTGVKGTVFNPGVSPMDAQKDGIDRAFHHKSDYQNINIDVMPGDPVSTTSLFLHSGQKKANWTPLMGIGWDTGKKLYADYQTAKAAEAIGGPEAGAAVGVASVWETLKSEAPKLIKLHAMDNFVPAATSTTTTPTTDTTTVTPSTSHRFTAQQLASEYNNAH